MTDTLKDRMEEKLVAQAALIRELGEPLSKIANETGCMPDEQWERDEIAEALAAYNEWLKEQEGAK